jgi:hypothetical protein
MFTYVRIKVNIPYLRTRSMRCRSYRSFWVRCSARLDELDDATTLP